ncbi:MAG: SPFH domain-containing protein, partial [Myxococcota bacterium]
LHNLAPVAAFPLAWWLYQERPGAAAMTGTGIALFGVALLSGVSIFQVSHFASSRFLMGDFLSLVSALGYAGVLVLTRMTRREQTPILGTLFVSWSIAAALLSVVALVFGGFLIPVESFLWILALAVVSTNLPFYLLNLGMRSVSAGMAAVLSLSEVLFATAIGMVVYGEHLAPIGWIGGVLAGLGVLYAITQRGDAESQEVDAESVLSDEVRSSRMMRAALGVVVLNVGVFLQWGLAIPTGGLLALVGLSILVRFGPGVAIILLDGRFVGAIKWLGLVLGGVVVFSTAQQIVETPIQGSFTIAVFAGLLFWVDRWLANREPSSDRDVNPLIGLALSGLALAHAFAWMGHGASILLFKGAYLAVGLTGMVAVLLAVKGSGLAAMPGLPAVEDRFGGWLKGRRPLVAIGTLWLLGSAHFVPTGHVGIIERFGKPVGQTETAGLFFRLPPPLETFTNVNVGVESEVRLSSRTMLTGDQSMVSLEATLRYAVSDASQFAYNTVDPEGAVIALARAVLVEVIAHKDQDAVLTTGREGIESEVLERLQIHADAVGLGVEVAAVHLTKVSVPPPVLASFLDVISADEEQLTRINQAEAYAADVLPRTRGEALANIVRTQGDAEIIEAKAVGYDVWFRSIQRNAGRFVGLTQQRLAFEHVERDLEDVRLIAAPTGVRVWVGDEEHWPKDVPRESDNGGGRK